MSRAYAEPRDLQLVFGYNYFATAVRRISSVENNVELPSRTAMNRSDLVLYDALFTGGQDYVSPSVIFVSPPGSGCVLDLKLSNGSVVDVEIVSRGSGYRVAPLVEITGDGVGAKVVLTVTDGQVRRAIIVSGGEGYSTISATVTTGSGAVGVPVVSSGRIVDVTIVSGGSGYSEAPEVVFSDGGGGGSGAEGYAVVENGQVVAVVMQSLKQSELTQKIMMEETESIDGMLRRYYPQYQYPLVFARECGAKAILRKWCVIKTGYRLITRELQNLVSNEERNKLASMVKAVDDEILSYTKLATRQFDFSDVISLAEDYEKDKAIGQAYMLPSRTNPNGTFLL